jgi:hypothetical protein
MPDALRTRLKPEALAVAGSTLGLAAGLVELVAGPHLRPWIGDKQDTTRLGLATIVLSLVALIATVGWLRRRHATPAHRLLTVACLMLPGLICFTTVGRLWWAPGTLLVAASLAIASELRHQAAEVRAIIGRGWQMGLTAVLAGLYVFLGATALGSAGALGILGGLLVLGGLVASARLTRWTRALLLLAAAVPFATLTWWSVITPLLGVLILVIGWGALGPRGSAGGTAGTTPLPAGPR